MKLIASEVEYGKLLEWIDIQINNKPNSDSKEGIILQNALNRIKAYEDIHYKIPLPECDDR
ncbi:hypothetical protein [Dyadobacter frigoris]|uniref:Uncharacterized protein n=1 Tax=Dyadobacter frigoris TaxID=2576211 RepID=A0A4U6D6J3_9BACT|nr:hypothetical protein [Dyadobacter frigoris]TKT93000.1 hypothetical protein FDK13_03845 [Dyadobacter frigoris]GLU55869.1 hypothetical protein Dfri01_53300 [Dyadobacter frigoris]